MEGAQPRILELSLPDRLKLETLRRIQSGVPLQLVLFTFLACVFSFYPRHGQSIYPLLFMTAFLIIIRWTFYRLKRNSEKDLLKYYHYQLTISLLLAVNYGVMVADSVFYFTTWTTQTAILMVSAMGVLTAVSQSLAVAPNYQKSYILLKSIPILTAFAAVSDQESTRAMGVLYALYVAYLFYSSRQISRDALHSYQLEALAQDQRGTLQKVINLVPGFVAMADGKGNWINYSESFLKIKDSHFFKSLVSTFSQREGFGLVTNEYAWSEQGRDYAFVISFRKYEHDLSTLVVGVPAEKLVEMRHQLDSQRSKAEYSARLATLGEMAGGVAHEINNPLAVIIGNCEHITRLIAEPEVDHNKIAERAESIAKTAFRIAKIISGLRAFARQADQDPIVDSSLRQLIDDTFELCREKFYHHNVKLDISAVPDIKVPMRAVQISQVLINLLTNAFDAVQFAEEKRVSMQFRIQNESLYISVSDSGAGVSEEIRNRIFDPFFTHKTQGHGTGLGLSISRGIILDHKGEIYLVTSTAMTTFEVRLPLKKE